MKLCVIGNSHAGILAAAFRERPHADLSLTFYAKPGLKPHEVIFDNGTIVANSDALRHALRILGTPERLDLTAFDGLILVAMSATVFTAVRLLSRHRIHGWPSTQTMAENIRTAFGIPSKLAYLSQAALHAALVEATQQKMAFAALKAIRRISEIPVFIVHQPYPSEKVLALEGRHPILKRSQRMLEGTNIGAALQKSYQDVYRPFSNTTCIPQPEHTVAHGFLTRLDYSRKSVQFAGKALQRSDDVLHANAAFGHLMLDAVLEQMPHQPLQGMAAMT